MRGTTRNPGRGSAALLRSVFCCGIILCGIILGPSFALRAQEAPVETSGASVEVPGAISEVTVFEDRARVERTLPVALAAGMNRIAVTDLPLSLDANSVWAELSAEGGPSLGRVLGVRLDRSVHVADIRAEVEALEARGLEIEARIEEMQARRNIEGKRRALANEYVDLVRTAMLERSTRADASAAESILAAEEWASAEGLAASDAIDAIDRERKDLHEEHRLVEENLRRLGAGAARTTYIAFVQIEATSAGAATLEIGYDVLDAWWTPVYEARLDEGTATVELAYSAEIAQRSGEDWTDAALVLSTQRSSLGFEPPVLLPIQIDGYEVSRRDAGLVSSEASDSIQGGESFGSDEDGDWGDDEVAIEDSGTVARFRVPVQATIPADGRAHRVPILEKSLAADLAFECVPVLAARTFRRGTMRNETGAPLLPGPVRVFRDGAYVGMTELESIAPGAEFTLGFGVEGRITVRRVERADRERTVGTFSKGQRRTRAHEFIVESRMPGPTAVVVVDRIPVSEIEGVDVELTKACVPKPEVDRDGICRWTLDLAPGAKRTVMFEFEVTVDSGVDFPVEAVD